MSSFINFIEGVGSDITSFFSGASNVVGGVVNFGSNLVNNIKSGIEAIVNGIGNIGNAIFRGISTLGSDLVSLFGDIGGAIVHAAVTFGSLFATGIMNAFHDIASALFGGLHRVASAFEDFAKWAWSGIVHLADVVYGGFEYVYHALREFAEIASNALLAFGTAVYNDLKVVFTAVWNGLVAVGQDIVNFFSGLASLPEDLANAVISFANDVVDDFANIPGNIAKFLATRMTAVMPRLVGWNTFWLTLRGMKDLASAMAIRSPGKSLLAYVSSPLVAYLASILSSSIVPAAFPETSTSSDPTSMVVPQFPQSNVSKRLVPPNIFTPVSNSPISPGYTASSFSRTVSPPKQVKHYVVGASVSDTLDLDNNVQVYNKLTSPFPLSAELVDDVAIVGNIVQTQAPVLSLSYADDLSTYNTALLRILAKSYSDTVDVDYTADVEVLTFVPGEPICTELSPLSSSTTTSDVVDVTPSTCVPTSNAVAETVDADVSVPSSIVELVPPSATPSDIVGADVSVSSGVSISGDTFGVSVTLG